MTPCPHPPEHIHETGRTIRKRCSHAPGGYIFRPQFKCSLCGRTFTADQLKRG